MAMLSCSSAVFGDEKCLQLSSTVLSYSRTHVHIPILAYQGKSAEVDQL
jgi:hypothetical protein